MAEVDRPYFMHDVEVDQIVTCRGMTTVKRARGVHVAELSAPESREVLVDHLRHEQATDWPEAKMIIVRDDGLGFLYTAHHPTIERRIEQGVLEVAVRWFACA